MNLNPVDYKYFDLAVQEINKNKMSKLRAKRVLLLGLGYFTASYCKEIKEGFVEAQRMVDFLVEVHDEYEVILAELDEREGGD